MKLLITGAMGFIGTNYVKYHLKNFKNDTLICVDNLTYAGNKDNLKKELNKQHVFFYQTNICDEIEMNKIFALEKPDIVINFAAESHVDRSINNPSIFVNSNVNGVVNLLNLSLKYNIKRFHQVSTDEVYGSLTLEDKDLFTEDSPLNPSSPYSASKASADHFVQAYNRTFGLNTTISRCSNNYGPYQFPEKLIPVLIKNARQGKSLPIYGQGINIRDWLHVLDHCKAINLIINNANSGDIYNIGGNNEFSNNDIAKIILDYYGKSHNLIKYVQDRKGHDLRYAIDPTKLKENLQFTPSINFEEGIISTIEWYENNLDFLEQKNDSINW